MKKSGLDITGRLRRRQSFSRDIKCIGSDQIFLTRLRHTPRRKPYCRLPQKALPLK